MPRNLIILVFAIFAFPAILHAEPLQVTPSPSSPSVLNLGEKIRILSLDVSKQKPQAAILAQDNGEYKLLLWDIGAASATEVSALPQGFIPFSVAVHPQGDAFFILGQKAPGYAILRLQNTPGAAPQEIFHSTAQITKLLAGPRPFQAERNGAAQYRIFFGAKTGDAYETDTIMEDGSRKYQVLGPKANGKEALALNAELTKDDGGLGLRAESALPAAFHPAGNMLLWRDGKDCLQKAEYDRTIWGSTSALAFPLCGGETSVTPNGLGLLHWQDKTAGLTLYLDEGKTAAALLPDTTFMQMPVMTADGRGVVGITDEATVRYMPAELPLADVANAWMFASNPDERENFTKHGGLFRETTDSQMYNLYESEFYRCGGYDSALPARPFLVTTDLFWEIFAAAYEGLFVREEQEFAIPAFWNFAAHAASDPALKGRLHDIFQTAHALQKNNAAPQNSELERIINAAGPAESPFFAKGKAVHYEFLKPTGHYAGNPEKERYFKALRWLSMIELTDTDAAQLRKMPKTTRAVALEWLHVYKPFIAPPRAPQILEKIEPPSYLGLSKKDSPTLFPLSWGLDNEILNSTVYHDGWPEKSTVQDRMLPSGMDLAAVLGSPLAMEILDANGEFQKYPDLKPVLASLKTRLGTAAGGDNLYDKWITALAEQWNDSVAANRSFFGGDMWPAKRLQTGLASWATLRHATALVNDRSEAECGEAGFEDIVMEEPRGYVEPDHATFEAIAGLFDTAVQVADSLPLHNIKEKGSDAPRQFINPSALREGLLARLAQAKGKALMFAEMARKEETGQPLSDADYDEIHYVARAAEYNFLVFKSLAREDLSLATPDPLPKVADVAGIPPLVLESAVGYPLEWDAITPYFGRRQITRGETYSYYEFQSDKLLNDKDWLQKLNSLKHPDWVRKYIVPEPLPCPPALPF
jgi:2-hydroxychromene-2-carboxylate isomerase